MKGFLVWSLGGIVAFLATAGAFLLLASLGSPSETSSPIPPAGRTDTKASSPTLVLNLSEERLAGLERAPKQSISLDIINGGDEDLAPVELELEILPPDAARDGERNYRKTLENLAPGETAAVEFEVDLSPALPARTSPSDANSRAREALQFDATAPGVAPAVKTAVLAP